MTHGAYMYLMGLLVGVLARSLFVAGIKDVARALARRPAPPLPPVNVFHGTVFPDPADPRWVDGPRDAAGAPTLRFGDSDITLGCLWLTVDGVEVERGLGTAGLYYDAVQAARSGAARARALASVDPQRGCGGAGGTRGAVRDGRGRCAYPRVPRIGAPGMGRPARRSRPRRARGHRRPHPAVAG